MNMKDIAKAIMVVGLASVSAWLTIQTGGEQGTLWGVVAILVLFF